MPRPTDFYTHDQFELVSGTSHNDGVIRCKHCQQWGGKSRPLQLKKIHLASCPAYATWRAAGNGQEIPPPNTYNKRNGSGLDDSPQNTSPAPTHVPNYATNYTPAQTRNRMPDIGKYFDEFWDDEATQKCMRSRCKYCGTQRAKNTTRQYEHLQQCSEFLSSTEGQQAVADGSLTAYQPGSADIASNSQPAVTKPYSFNPGPNPNFARPVKVGRPSKTAKQAAAKALPPVVKPSLISYLLVKLQEPLTAATQKSFLEHAGRGSLPAEAVSDFITQQSHLSRALPTFIGKLIGKLRLPPVSDPQTNTDWRAFDLLASTLNNAKRELDFLRSTALKYHIDATADPPRHAAKALIDLLESASAPSASLLEGSLVLCALEHLHLVSWHHAERSRQEQMRADRGQPGHAPPMSTSYSLPTYYQSPYGTQQPPWAPPVEDHIAALREALIPNWTSAGFSQFVDACKAIVDELANAQTAGSGAKELENAEGVFGQVVWAWGMMWPEVKEPAVEEEANSEEEVIHGESTQQHGGNGVGSGESPISIDGDDKEDGDGEGQSKLEDADDSNLFG